MEANSLSYTTLKNSAYTFVNYVFPILFSVFITPVVVRRLGVEDFGVYVLVNTIIGFLGLLDIGFSAALLKYVAEYYGRRDFAALQKLISSANSLFFIIGFISLLSFLVCGIFLLPWFHIGLASQSHILLVFFLAGILSFITAVSSIYTIVPAALLRFDITAKSSLAQLTVFNISTLIAVMLGYKLKIILVLNIITSTFLALYLRTVFNRLLPEVKFRLGWEKAEILKAYKFGLLAAASNISNSLLTQFDRLLIPKYAGTSGLSYYSLPGNVAQKTTGITGSLSGVLFPLASNVAGQGLDFKLADIYKRTIRTLTVVAAACTAAMVVFAHQILEFWLGKEFADKGAEILIILALTYFLLSIFGLLINFLMGMNKVKFLAGCSIVMAVVNIALLFLLLPTYGILGAAWAYLGAAFLVPIIFAIAEKKYFQLENQAGFYLKLYAKVIFTALVFLGLGHFIFKPLITSFISLVIIGPFTVLTYFVLYKLFNFFEEEDWNLFLLFLNKIKEKFIKKGA